MRMNLSYRQASDNSYGVARAAYDKVVAAGGTIEEAQAASFKAYEAEMKWYES